ncbi:MAG: TVP38/TMEM64 family protein [Clostridiales bacterium]|nr:TVP38/TMEM64 family protein [Clostridiales bacterium]
MENRSKSKTRFIKFLPVLGILIFTLVYLIAGRDISIDTLLSYSPENLYLAILFMLMLYMAKSMTIFFPLIVLEVLGGIIFPVGLAILVNILGNAVSYTLPYMVGRFTGADVVEYIIKRQPKFEMIYDFQKENEWFLSFFLRAISILSCDMVSMYLGAQKTPYFKFLSGSLLGNLCAILSATIIGASILNPLSAPFIISVFIRISIALLSLLFYYNHMKKKRVSGRARKIR